MHCTERETSWTVPFQYTAATARDRFRRIHPRKAHTSENLRKYCTIYRLVSIARILKMKKYMQLNKLVNVSFAFLSLKRRRPRPHITAEHFLKFLQSTSNGPVKTMNGNEGITRYTALEPGSLAKISRRTRTSFHTTRDCIAAGSTASLLQLGPFGQTMSARQQMM